MPEYLAPAVYIEETSFRPKPLEGVGTSTTAFVGTTRRGPVSSGNPASLSADERELMVPELVTSVGDFERLYGGTSPIAGGTNYLAHAVRGFFANGGGRLYVARVFEAAGGNDDGRAHTAWLIGDGDVQPSVRFEARTPGSAGNGSVTLTQLAAPASLRSLASAVEGTMIRTGAASPAHPATLEGGTGPFRVTHNSTVALEVNGTPVTVTFEGTVAEVSGGQALTAPLVTIGADEQLDVTINGLQQTIALPEGDISHDALLSFLNRQLQGGATASIDANVLTLGSEVRGLSSSVSVEACTVLGFMAPDADDGMGNVQDLNSVSITEFGGLLVAAAAAETEVVSVFVNPLNSSMTIVTEDTGVAATLEVLDTSTAHTALGLAVGESTGQDGTTIAYYVKRGSAWFDSSDAVLDPLPSTDVEFITVNVVATDADGFSQQFDDLAFDAAHPSYIGSVLAPMPSRRRQQLDNLVGLRIDGTASAFELRTGLLNSGLASGAAARFSIRYELTDGNDGAPLNAERFNEALRQLEGIDDISIVAAPGSSALAGAQAIRDHLITHVEQPRLYRIAVLDTPPEQTISEARETRSTLDSDHAALYYPWIIVSNPDARPGDRSRPAEISVPPSGHICGIYARNDAERGVYKAPANEVVRGALRFESSINMRQQEVLNPEGINALRSFPGRGHRVWGARLASSNPEFKYVNVRRYFNYVSATLDRGTQWVVFEPNGELLWDRVRATVSDFLYDEWLGGALLGRTQNEAFFVRCDRATMTQNDIDNGRLVCEVGMAVIKPAEFVIFRIGQKTANASA